VSREEVFNLLVECRLFVMALLPSVFRLRHDVKYKADGSPVTAADFYIERQLSEWLKNRIPGLGVIGEESYKGDFIDADSYVALLDPIDGTENFCSGLKEWGVSVGIWKGGRHLGSMLLMPELSESLISGEQVDYMRSRISGFSSSFHDDIPNGMRDADEYRVTGCAVYNIYNVVRGAFCRFYNPKGAYAWDFLPGVMLALEHGCEVIIDGERFDGRFLDPNRKYRIDIRSGHDFHIG